VDDNVDVADSLKTLLELMGHEAWMVHDGPAALEALRELHPDVAFIDIGLPLLDGFEVAKQARRRGDAGGCILVAVTGYGRAEDKDQAMQAGFDLHLTKPVGLDVIRGVLATRGSRDTHVA
jgi:CheY-like chemotaxis protein